MDIKLYNTKTGKKETFKPLKGDLVKMYNCGPTVYGYVHLGNLRAYVFVDILRRTLEYNNYSVKQVINITDVGHLTDDGDNGDDKIEESAKRQKKTATEIVEYFTQVFFQDLTDLQIKTDNTLFPKATDHIQEQIKVIKKIEENGLAYTISDGVYFDVSKLPNYNVFPSIDLDHLQVGARVKENKEKRHPFDFALWKFSKPNENRQQEWDSPWGKGFPGWHLECSAMAIKHLGETLDIHTGGIDHIFPHHTNEIAQSKTVTGKEFSRFWLHNAFLNLKGEKIAKSKGNFMTLSDLKEKGFDPLTFKLFIWSGHYRTPMNFDWETIEDHSQVLKKMRTRVFELNQESKDTGQVIKELQTEFLKYLNDDLNTPQALAIVWQTLKSEEHDPADKLATVLDMDRILGLNLQAVTEIKIPQDIEEKAEQRDQARQNKDWTESDRLREEIEKSGFEVKDKGEKSLIIPGF